MCDQLELPQHVQDDAWKRFLRTSGQVPPRKAEHACMAILYACMDGETAVTGGEIIDAVKTHFGRKRIPSMSKLLHRFAHMLGDGGARNHDKYVFNTMLRRLTADPRHAVGQARPAQAVCVAPLYPTCTKTGAPRAGQGMP